MELKHLNKLDMNKVKEELIDFLDYIRDEWMIPTIYNHSDIVNSYLKSINSDEPSERRAVNRNEQAKEVCKRCDGTGYVERPSIVMPCPDCTKDY